MSTPSLKKPAFKELGLSQPLLSALAELGYETPTPIQEQSIPILLNGDDILAQAQTGTGKTAAFALPILSHLNIKSNKPQALVIAPTRELAIQVSEAFQSYARNIKGFHVTPIYGGQDYNIQLRALKRGAQVIVGTPGRVMDHLRRKTLDLSTLKTIVLDEADEMLKMGFIDDIEWILEQIPKEHQTALFSATLPLSIQKIAKRYLNKPQKVHIKPKEMTVNAIEQFYTLAANNQKLDVLTRLLEVEDIQAAIIFTRTKNSSAELSERLQARGHAAAALNGDMSQSLREKVITKLKKGSLDIIVATDVAARGIDVERVSHVINYDIPHDTESYIHRIGRTGRAGRKGKAILLITHREKRLLDDIEHAVHTSIKQLAPPSLQEMSEKRSKELAEKVINIIDKSKRLKPHYKMVEDIMQHSGCEAQDVAAALAYLIQQSNPLPENEIEVARTNGRHDRKPAPKRRSKSFGESRGRGNDRKKPGRKTAQPSNARKTRVKKKEPVKKRARRK